jgi:hypothetical protein
VQHDLKPGEIFAYLKRVVLLRASENPGCLNVITYCSPYRRSVPMLLRHESLVTPKRIAVPEGMLRVPAATLHPAMRSLTEGI